VHVEASWSGTAQAKINLHLRVLEREASGYHRLETVFQALELSDSIHIRLGDGDSPARAGAPGIGLEVTGVPDGSLGPPEENLVMKATRRFFDEVGDSVPIPRSMTVHLEKRIPHGAGLGGGSSDGAAVLRGLNELLGHPFPVDDLVQIGRDLGADVPFFLSGASCALGVGRGDQITPVPALPPRPVLLAVPAPGVSTGWAYGVLAARRIAEGGSARSPANPASLAQGDWRSISAAALNDFEEALFPLRPDLESAKAALVETGARPALLCGSGSAVFGIFDDDLEMDGAAAQIGAALPEVRLIRTRTSA
jgi:4-diphosphocytidyl-2-C-methyl-D-erythritol kinase